MLGVFRQRLQSRWVVVDALVCCGWFVLVGHVLIGGGRMMERLDRQIWVRSW